MFIINVIYENTVFAGNNPEHVLLYACNNTKKFSSILLFIIIPLTALPLRLIVRKQRPYFFGSLIFSTEYNSFFRLAQFFIIPALWFFYALLTEVFHFKYTQDQPIFFLLGFAMLFWFLYHGLKRFAGLQRIRLILLMLLMLAWHIISVYFIYRFPLLVIVFLQMH